MKYIKVYNKGFETGMIDAYRDLINNRIKTFKKIDDFELKSKLYDIGYIKGYKKTIYTLLIDMKI